MMKPGICPACGHERPSRDVLREWFDSDVPPTAAQAVEALGISRTRAYQLAHALGKRFAPSGAKVGRKPREAAVHG